MPPWGGTDHGQGGLGIRLKQHTEGWQPQRAQTCEHQVPKSPSTGCPNPRAAALTRLTWLTSCPGREKSDPA